MSARTWSESEREKQALAIRKWKPWTLSTGPQTTEGKKIVSKNAWKGGLWGEDRDTLKVAHATLRNQKNMLKDLKLKSHQG